MSAQRLALNNFLRSGPRIVCGPHNPSVLVEGRDKDKDENAEQKGLLVETLPCVNFDQNVRNVPLFTVAPWALLPPGTPEVKASKEEERFRDVEWPSLADAHNMRTPKTVTHQERQKVTVEMGCQTEEVAVNAEAAQMRFRSLQWELENQLGEDLFQSGQCEDAFPRFLKAAENGNLDAMRHVAECYDRGLGCAPSKIRAYQWWKRAADGGDLKALYEVAICHITGEGVAASQSLGQQYMKTSALRGNSDAAFYIVCLCIEENRSDEAIPYMGTALLCEEHEASLREALEQGDLPFTAQVMLREFLKHENVANLRVSKEKERSSLDSQGDSGLSTPCSGAD